MEITGFLPFGFTHSLRMLTNRVRPFAVCFHDNYGFLLSTFSNVDTGKVWKIDKV